MKLAAIAGLFLFTLYFLISWRMEAQRLTEDLSDAEKSYGALLKRVSRMETEIKG